MTENLNHKKDPLPDADSWNGKPCKLDYLEHPEHLEKDAE